MSVELISTPKPHLIPGYTGFCPQYKYRIGDTYASTTHKLLLDPTVSHAEKLVLSDGILQKYQSQRPSQRDIDIVNERYKKGDVVYKHPAVPGYEGFIPRMNSMFGHRYAVQATEGLSEFAQLNRRDQRASNQLKRQGALQDGTWEPRTLQDRQIVKSEFKLPLLPVRPECAGVLRNLSVETTLSSPTNTTSPYFMINADPEKYLKQGGTYASTTHKLLLDPTVSHAEKLVLSDRTLNDYQIQRPSQKDVDIITAKYKKGDVAQRQYGFTGHVPCGYAAFGKTSQAMTNTALCDFTSNYNKRLSTEWAPVILQRPDPQDVIPASEIYLKEIGQLPNYAGHIPGAIFRFGKTYGNDSRDAKRWLRGDFST